MTIVWGHNNFRLKAADPAEIGIFDKEISNYKFELRQKYGHLFWIPFIPLGKFWVIKKPDGKLYHCPPDIEARLKEQFPIRTSVWAWSGPLLIIAGLLIFNISEKIEEGRWQKEAKERYAQAATAIDEKIKTIKPNDYLLFTVKPVQKDYYDYTKVPVKVLRVNGDTIVAGRISSVYMDADEGKTIINSGNDATNYNSEADIAGMEFSNGIKDSFIISKTILQTAVCHDNLNESKFPGTEIKNFTTVGNCLLKDIVHVAGPVLKKMELAPEKRDGKYYEFKNMGFNVKADSIVTSKKDGLWLLSKERQFFYGDVIAIKCNTKDSAILYSSDMQKKVYKNRIDNTGYSLQFDAVAK